MSVQNNVKLKPNRNQFNGKDGNGYQPIYSGKVVPPNKWPDIPEDVDAPNVIIEDNGSIGNDVIWPRTSREEAIFKQGEIDQLSHFNWYCAGIGFCVSSLFWALMVYISG